MIFGTHHTIETKKKISESQKGKKMPLRTKEHCEKIRQSLIEQWRSGKRKPFFGLKYTEKSKQKMRLAKLGKKQSPEHIQKRANSNRHYRIKDRSLLKKANEERNDYAHRDWSKNVKKRDNWKCRIDNCDCNGKVVAHHILPWRNYPELRYNISNGITLCQFHHPRKRVEEQKLIPFFQKMVEVIGIS